MLINFLPSFTVLKSNNMNIVGTDVMDMLGELDMQDVPTQ